MRRTWEVRRTCRSRRYPTSRRIRSRTCAASSDTSSSRCTFTIEAGDFYIYLPLVVRGFDTTGGTVLMLGVP